MGWFRTGTIAFVTASALALPFAAADAAVLVGSPGTVNSGGNRFPFGTYEGEYQQAYSSSLFSSQVTISALTFFAADSTIDVNGTFTVSLSYSALPVGSLTTNYASNIGSGSTTLFSGALSFTDVPSVTFGGLSSFTYDPSQGDLLLDVVASSTSTDGQFAFRFQDFPQFQRVYNAGGTGQPTGFLGANTGLVTEFVTSPAVAVPGPLAGAGLVPLLGLGLVAMRRRKQKLAA